jgi:hypothetical protein
VYSVASFISGIRRHRRAVAAREAGSSNQTFGALPRLLRRIDHDVCTGSLASFLAHLPLVCLSSDSGEIADIPQSLLRARSGLVLVSIQGDSCHLQFE